MPIDTSPADVIADYLDECDVEEFVDEDFSESAAKDIIQRLEDAGFVIMPRSGQ